ncbi:MAG: hypothetical protein AAF825_13170, partial [Pseudomonadota bacterium]
MTVEFALFLSPDGIALAHRQGPGHWALIGDTPLDVPDLGAQLRRLRQLGEARAGGYFPTLLILPNDQIFYGDLPVDDGPGAELSASVGRALAGRTPYQISELAYDFRGLKPGIVQVAAVAQHTLTEAMDFARRAGFNGVGFAASPPFARFQGVPIFEMAAGFNAPSHLGDGLEMGPDLWGDPDAHPDAQGAPGALGEADRAPELSAEVGQVFVAEIISSSDEGADSEAPETASADGRETDPAILDEAQVDEPGSDDLPEDEYEDAYEDIDDIEAQLAQMSEFEPDPGPDLGPVPDSPPQEAAKSASESLEKPPEPAMDDAPSFALELEPQKAKNQSSVPEVEDAEAATIDDAPGEQAAEEPAHFAIISKEGSPSDELSPEPQNDAQSEPATPAPALQFGTARRRDDGGAAPSPTAEPLVRRPSRIAIIPAGDPASGIAITPHGGPLRRDARLSFEPTKRELEAEAATQPAPDETAPSAHPVPERADPPISRRPITADAAPLDLPTEGTSTADDVPSLPAALAARATLPPKLAETLKNWRARNKPDAQDETPVDLKTALESPQPVAAPN